MNMRKLFFTSSDNFIAELASQEPNFISLDTACKMDAGFPTYTAKMFSAVLPIVNTTEKAKYLAQYLMAQLQHHIGDQVNFISLPDSATFSIRFKKPLDIHALLHHVKLEGSQIEVETKNSLKITLHDRTKFSAIYFVAQEFKAGLGNEYIKNPLLTDLFSAEYTMPTLVVRPRL